MRPPNTRLRQRRYRAEPISPSVWPGIVFRARRCRPATTDALGVRGVNQQVYSPPVAEHQGESWLPIRTDIDHRKSRSATAIEK